MCVCVCVCVYLDRSSSLIMAYVRNTASSETSSSSRQIYCFLFLLLLFSVSSSSSCLPLLTRHPVTFIFSALTSFGRQFLPKMWSIQLSLLLLHVGYSFRPWLYVILDVTRDRPNWSSPSFLQHHISNLLSEVFKFQQQTELLSNCSSWLISSLNLSRICWWRVFPLSSLLLPWQS